jgi:hypothetical protein
MNAGAGSDASLSGSLVQSLSTAPSRSCVRVSTAKATRSSA